MHQILNPEKRGGVTMDMLKFQAFSSQNLFETKVFFCEVEDQTRIQRNGMTLVIGKTKGAPCTTDDLGL